MEKNAEFVDWMKKAQDSGYFNDRLYQGKNEAVSGRVQDKVQKLHHLEPKLVSGPGLGRG